VGRETYLPSKGLALFERASKKAECLAFNIVIKFLPDLSSVKKMKIDRQNGHHFRREDHLKAQIFEVI